MKKGIKLGGSLGEWADKAKDFAQDTAENLENVVENTMKDIVGILEDIGNCGEAIDSIRLKVMNRHIEYHTEMMRTMIDGYFITHRIMDAVWELVASEIKRDPKPAIYHLSNPMDKSSAVKIDIDNFEFPEGRIPFLFVHGMDYQPTKESAYGFFDNFNDDIKLFNHPDYKEYDVYLVSYDTDLKKNIEDKIRDGFIRVLGVLPIGNANPLILAIFWRELERRAKVTGDYILAFLEKLYKYTSRTEALGIVLTHSLGGFTFASAAQAFYEKGYKNPLFGQWLCMAPALPASGFAGTGDFKLAPRITKSADGPRFGTSIWYSRLDWALNGPYAFVNAHLAMGITGPLESEAYITRMDVTNQVRAVHEGKYFELLREELRYALRI